METDSGFWLNWPERETRPLITSITVSCSGELSFDPLNAKGRPLNTYLLLIKSAVSNSAPFSLSYSLFPLCRSSLYQYYQRRLIM